MNGSTWRCIDRACADKQHPYRGWEHAQAQMKKHAREVAHDSRWPLTITLHDATGRQFAVTYVEADR